MHTNQWKKAGIARQKLAKERVPVLQSQAADVADLIRDQQAQKDLAEKKREELLDAGRLMPAIMADEKVRRLAGEIAASQAVLEEIRVAEGRERSWIVSR